jgi:hypothetical protein
MSVPDLSVCRALSRVGGGKRGSRFLLLPEGATAPSPHQWQGPSPLPQCSIAPCPAGGPKPPASARPAHGGRFAPAGSGAGLCPSRTHRSTGHRPERARKRGSRFLFPPTMTTAPLPPHWQGPSPLPQRYDGIRTGRGQSPRPGPAGLQGTVARGRGKRAAFPDPARTGDSVITASMAGAIAPATASRWPLTSRGPKAPGQRPPRPRRALRPRRVWRRPLSFLDLPVYRAPPRAGGGNAGRVS